MSFSSIPSNLVDCFVVLHVRQVTENFCKFLQVTKRDCHLLKSLQLFLTGLHFSAGLNGLSKSVFKFSSLLNEHIFSFGFVFRYHRRVITLAQEPNTTRSGEFQLERRVLYFGVFVNKIDYEASCHLALIILILLLFISHIDSNAIVR